VRYRRNSLTDAGRYAQAIRLLRLAAMLRRRPSSIDEIAVAMNVSSRTARRDLEALEAIAFRLAQLSDGRWQVVGDCDLDSHCELVGQ
jgi:predicted DNA-binding transcriptional regulator YafY